MKRGCYRLQKDHIRDYATEAFRLYKRENGLKGYANKLKSLADAKEKASGCSGVSKPTESAVIHLEKLIEERASEIADLQAVENVLYMLGINDKPDISKAIEYVYFVDADKPILKGDIQDRVQQLELKEYINVRTAYRALKYARNLFAVERGLRI